MSDGFIDIELYIKGFNENDPRYKSLALLYLDHLVGEYLTMTKIGSIEFRKLSFFTRTPGLIPLPELSEVIKNIA